MFEMEEEEATKNQEEDDDDDEFEEQLLLLFLTIGVPAVFTLESTLQQVTEVTVVVVSSTTIPVM